MTPDGDLQFSLGFSRQEDSRTRIQGEVSASLEFECQACLEIFVHKISCRIDALVVNRFEELLELEQHENGIVAEKSFISLSEIVEDELILALPAYPNHPDGKCDLPSSTYSNVNFAELEQKDMIKPFSDLSRLLNNDVKEGESHGSSKE